MGVRAKAQASMDYLVVIAVVILIALVVTALLGGFIQIGEGSSNDESRTYWRTAEVGLLDWSIKEDGTLNLYVRNNEDKRIKLTKMTVGGEDISITPTYLRVGEKKTITGSVSSGSGRYSKTVGVEYASGKFELVKAFEGVEPIVGTYIASAGGGGSTTTTTGGGGGGSSTLPSSGLSCSVKSSCDAGESDVFHMSAATNAHAELASQSNYASKVCCMDQGGGSLTVGSGTTIINLHAATNAHAEKPGAAGSYTSEVKLSANAGTISCSYPTSNCAGGNTCLATLSAETNAHVGDCSTSPYSVRVCCKIA